MEKIYKVTFIQYTNAFKNAVYNLDLDEYLDTGPDGALLITEEQVPYMQKFGIKEMVFIGYLYNKNKEEVL